jgi:hypothetical protein
MATTNSRLSSAWAAIPELAKLSVALVTGIGVASVTIGTALDIPRRVTTLEVSSATHSTQISSLQSEHAASERRLAAIDQRIDYIICLLETQYTSARKSPSECAADYVRGTR